MQGEDPLDDPTRQKRSAEGLDLQLQQIAASPHPQKTQGKPLTLHNHPQPLRQARPAQPDHRGQDNPLTQGRG